MKIAEALVLRKHLEAKVEQLKPLKINGDNGLFELKIERTKVSEEVDEAKIQIPKVSLKEVTKEYDMYSKALRELDTAVQQANWTAEVDFKTPTGVNV
jgi:ribosome-associated translation inhibitor RaiA